MSAPSIPPTSRDRLRVILRPSEVTFSVPFHDVDKMGIVWHGHYLKYFEYARTKLLQDLGFGGEIGEKFPYTWVVIDSRVRHTAPLHFTNEVRVVARLVDVDYRIQIAYEVMNLTTSKRAAKGQTTLATLDGSGDLLVETPDEVLTLLTEPVA